MNYMTNKQMLIGFIIAVSVLALAIWFAVYMVDNQGRGQNCECIRYETRTAYDPAVKIVRSKQVCVETQCKDPR